MTRFIGLDAHTQSCTAVVMGSAGRRLREQLLDTDAGVLEDFVRGVRRPRRLCMEEGTHCAWLYEVLEPLVDELVVVQPPKERGHKSDSSDAWKLADRLRQSSIQGRVFKPQGLSELREAVQAHVVVQRDLVRVKNRLNAMARARGLHDVATKLYDPNARHDVINLLPEHNGHRVRIWCDQLDMLVDCQEQAEVWLHDVASRTNIVARLKTAPGIGIVRAAQIAAVVVSPHRFRTKRQFWSYCGLAVVTRASSEHVRGRHGQWVRKHNVVQTRGLNQNRHPLLKSVFKGAANRVIGRMPDHPLNKHYERMIEKTKPNLARLTIARRIAAAVLAMWKNNEDYDLDKHKS